MVLQCTFAFFKGMEGPITAKIRAVVLAGWTGLNERTKVDWGAPEK